MTDIRNLAGEGDIGMGMTHKQIGDMVRTLRAGKPVPCPDCDGGVIRPKRVEDVYFRCDKCNYSVRLNRAFPPGRNIE